MILPPPNWLTYDQVNKKIIWEAVPEAELYQIDVKPLASTEWSIFTTEENELPFDRPVGAYEAKGKTFKAGDWGPQKLFEFEIE